MTASPRAPKGMNSINSNRQSHAHHATQRSLPCRSTPSTHLYRRRALQSAPGLAGTGSLKICLKPKRFQHQYTCETGINLPPFPLQHLPQVLICPGEVKPGRYHSQTAAARCFNSTWTNLLLGHGDHDGIYIYIYIEMSVAENSGSLIMLLLPDCC